MLGNVFVDGKITKDNFKITKKDIIGILLNLDDNSPNKNTCSLFLNGERAVRISE
jgi:hypothetical protein